MNAKRISTNDRNQAPMRPKDWFVLGAGLAVVVALVTFVLVRANRRPTEAPVAMSTPAPAPVPAAATPRDDHDHGAEASVPRMTAVELRATLDRGEAVVLDVRDLDSYAAGHIPGSLHIPLSFVESQAPYLPRDKTIVAYCT